MLRANPALAVAAAAASVALLCLASRQRGSRRRHAQGGAKSFAVLAPCEKFDGDGNDALRGVLESEGVATYGRCANHANEVKFAEGYTHAVLWSFPDKEARRRSSEFQQLKAQIDMSSEPIKLDYEPKVMKVGSVSRPALFHIFFAKFKPGAPMEELIAGYAGLTAVIPEMKAFEYGKLDPVDSQGFEYIFMTTFDCSAGRDVYLAHPEHDKFAKHIFGFIDKIVIMDFFEEDS